MPFEMDSTISIHAPREGGDIFIHRIFTQQLNFNPRPREGGDLSGKSSSRYVAVISIHTPVRGATV